MSPSSEPAYLAAPGIFYRLGTPEDLPEILRLERAGYAADESASAKQMEMRMTQANELFMVALEGPEKRLVGYVTSTASSYPTFTYGSMHAHDPNGTLVCIHSVCVEENHRHHGIATSMLRAYVRMASASYPKVEKFALICKQRLVPLYTKAGFELSGPSEVAHGKDPWFEMTHVAPTATGPV